MNTNNTDKPMELKELPVNPCNNCENPNQMRDKRCGNCRFNAGVNYAIKTIVPQAIQATREDIEKKRDADINTLNVEFPDYIGVHPVESMHPRKAWLEARIGVCRELLDSLTNKRGK